MENIGIKLKELRKLHNLSANQLGAELDVNPTTITKIETGASLPSMYLLDKICKYFNVKPVEFFEEKPELSADLRDLLTTAKELPPEKVQILIASAKAMK